MTATEHTTPYRSDLSAGRDGFAQLLRAEWTKLRTVRGWVTALMVAALVTMLLGLVLVAGNRVSCSKGPVEVSCPAPPVGPGGQAVEDRFYFVHQSLPGNGSITVRVTRMTGRIKQPPPPGTVGSGPEPVPGVVPWAKAGVMIKASTEQGSAYAALMVTGSHGVRMQHNFTEDVAGRPGGVSPTSPRWLRLTRAGDTITGYESTDGINWTRVGTAHLAGLPTTVRVGLFAASPGDLTVQRDVVAGVVTESRFAEATAVFDHVSLQGGARRAEWSHDDVGVTFEPDEVTPHHPGRHDESGGTFTVTGTGDIGPFLDAGKIERSLIGVLAGLVVVIVVAVLFITAEYRRGLIRATLAASPRRGRVLAAKAIVVGAVTFVVGVIAAGVTLPVGTGILRANGNYVLPVSTFTELRVIVGTAALLAVAAVFALALGALFRRSAAAVVAAIAAILVPYVLAIASVLPDAVSQWLLRVTPAAAFAVQQSSPEYSHVIAHYAPVTGYFPLVPWAGFAVLCGYTAVALGLATFRLRRRDA